MIEYRGAMISPGVTKVDANEDMIQKNLHNPQIGREFVGQLKARRR